MSVQTIRVADALQHLKTLGRAGRAEPLAEPKMLENSPKTTSKLKISQIIDARSPGEFALDRLPGAENWPVLDDEERALIGTMYKQINSFEAQKKGAGLVAANIAKHIESKVLELPRDWQPLIYCWRGGKRSGSLATVLGAIGFKVQLLEGGYKAFRSAVIEDIPASVEGLNFQVICGPTGSGKTLLLHKLKEQGAQVLDLELIAAHRSSVLGKIPGTAQPSQKSFETTLWFELNQLDPSRVVYVESESRKIGNLSVPESLIMRMRASPCVDLQLPISERVKLLLAEYHFFVEDGELFMQRLQALLPLLGKDVITRWGEWIKAKETPRVVEELLSLHYDPAYSGSIERNFVQFKTARACVIDAYTENAFMSAAKQVMC